MKSWKRKQYDALGKGEPIRRREYDLMIVVADLVEATAPGLRSDAAQALLDDVRAAEAANPEGGGGGQ